MSNKNYHILIVDDEPGFHVQIRRVFRRGYSFNGAVGPIDLDKKLNSEEIFDLVLLDLVLDDSKKKVGFELIPKIKERHPNTPKYLYRLNRHFYLLFLPENFKIKCRFFLFTYL